MKRLLLSIILSSALCGTAMQAGAQAKSAIERNNAGVAFMQRDLFKDAAAAFGDALAADPSFDLARINLGIALFYDHNSEGALKVMADVRKTEPRNPYAVFISALVWKNLGDQEKAIELLRLETEIDPACSASHYNLGLLYSRQDRLKEAENALRRVLELDPNHTGALYNLGSLLAKTGRAEEGKRMLEKFRQQRARAVPQVGMGSGTGYGEVGKYAIAQEFQGAKP